MAIYQGRPARLRQVDCRVPIAFRDEYDEFEPFNSIGYSKLVPATLGQPTHSVSTFEQLCKLSTMADRILYTLYTEACADADPAELSQKSQVLHKELLLWRQQLPAQLNFSFDTHGKPGESTGGVALPHTLSLM